MANTSITNNVTGNVTPLRPVTPRKSSRRASRKAANERQRRYRQRKAAAVTNGVTPSTETASSLPDTADPGFAAPQAL
jgi:hypothetical protein